MLIIRDSFDTFCFRALDGCLGFLLVAFWGFIGLTSGALGCSTVSLGVLLASFWMLLRFSSLPIRCSGVLQNELPTTFAFQTSISRKCFYFQRIIVIFDARRVGLDPKIAPRKVHRV